MSIIDNYEPANAYLCLTRVKPNPPNRRINVQKFHHSDYVLLNSEVHRYDIKEANNILIQSVKSLHYTLVVTLISVLESVHCNFKIFKVKLFINLTSLKAIRGLPSK